MTNEPAIGTTYEQLDRAIQRYVAESVQGGIVSEWTITVEHVNPSNTRNILVFLSEGMTGWKLYGMAMWSYRRMMSLVQTALDGG